MTYAELYFNQPYPLSDKEKAAQKLAYDYHQYCILGDWRVAFRKLREEADAMGISKKIIQEALGEEARKRNTQPQRNNSNGYPTRQSCSTINAVTG